MPLPLPDARDGLNPWSRLILKGLVEADAASDGRHLKTVKLLRPIAASTGASVVDLYAVLLRLARDWVCRYPLIDNQGNIGSIDGDPPAGMRYNEMRLSRFGEAILAEGAPDSPAPSHFPHLLCNGSWTHGGRVVTVSTIEARNDEMETPGPEDTVPLDEWTGGELLSHFPPHNLGEIATALLHLIDHPQADLNKILELVSAPDFPTGGTVIADGSLRRLYETGTGALTILGRAQLEAGQRGKKVIEITEIPYGVSKTALIEDIAGKVKEKEILGISDIRDLSSREGMCLQIEVRRGYDEERVLSSVMTDTPMKHALEFRMIASGAGAETPVSLLQLMQTYLEHRRKCLGLRKGRNGDDRLRVDVSLWREQSDPRRTQIRPVS